VAADVRHQAVAVVFEAQIAGDLRSGEQQPPEQLGVLRTRMRHGHDGLAGDHQHMGGRLGADVCESDAVFVVV